MDEGDTVIVKAIRIATATMLRQLPPRRDRGTDKGLILSLFPIAPKSCINYINGNKDHPVLDGKCRTRQGRHEIFGMMEIRESFVDRKHFTLYFRKREQTP